MTRTAFLLATALAAGTVMVGCEVELDPQSPDAYAPAPTGGYEGSTGGTVQPGAGPASGKARDATRRTIDRLQERDRGIGDMADDIHQ